MLAGTPLVPVVFFLAEEETGPAPEGAGGPAEGTLPSHRGETGPEKLPRKLLRREEATFFFLGCKALEVEGEEAAADDDEEDEDDDHDTFLLFFVSFLRTDVRSAIQGGAGAAVAEATGPGRTCTDRPKSGVVPPRTGTTSAGMGISGTAGTASTASVGTASAATAGTASAATAGTASAATAWTVSPESAGTAGSTGNTGSGAAASNILVPAAGPGASSRAAEVWSLQRGNHERRRHAPLSVRRTALHSGCRQDCYHVRRVHQVRRDVVTWSRYRCRGHHSMGSRPRHRTAAPGH